MPEDDDYVEDEASTESNADRNWKALREKANRADELERKLAERERKDAFRDAGLDPADRQHAYFIRGYDGELDPAKIRAEASEAGFLRPPAEEAEVPNVRQPLEGMQRINQAAEGAPPPQAPDPYTELNELQDLANKERWDTEKFNDAITDWSRKHGVPTAYDGA
jgi:hypothetical protein